MAATAPSQRAQSSVPERPLQQRRSADTGLESTHAPPSKLPRLQSDAGAVLYNHVYLGHVLANDSEDDLWDGSEPCTSTGTGWTNYHMAMTATQVSQDVDTSKEQKAIQKEIPWQIITQREPQVIQKFMAAIRK
eukprot:3463106-Amphidinium_carterae.1